ncbi:hypothetical protein SEUCBS139899_010022 [Sporothrix eucalyptigena]
MAVVAFGTGATWFVESPSQWKWSALPNGVVRFFGSTTGSKVSHVHNLVFGANNSFMMAWRGQDGCLPTALEAWLDEKNAKGNLVRDVPNIRLALGPNNRSFFVSDGKNCFWQNLPAPLDKAIEARRKNGGGFTRAPRIVALGISGNYVLIDDGDVHSFILHKYPALEKQFKEMCAANGNQPGALRDIAYVSLDVFDGVNFVATTHNGEYTGEVPNGGEVEESFQFVLNTLPKRTSIATPARRGKTSSGFGTFLKLASVVLSAEANAVNNANSGGGARANALDLTQQNMAFTQGLQTQMWDSVDAAASWNPQ